MMHYSLPLTSNTSCLNNPTTRHHPLHHHHEYCHPPTTIPVPIRIVPATTVQHPPHIVVNTQTTTTTTTITLQHPACTVVEITMLLQSQPMNRTFKTIPNTSRTEAFRTIALPTKSIRMMVCLPLLPCPIVRDIICRVVYSRHDPKQIRDDNFINVPLRWMIPINNNVISFNGWMASKVTTTTTVVAVEMAIHGMKRLHAIHMMILIDRFHQRRHRRRQCMSPIRHRIRQVPPKIPWWKVDINLDTDPSVLVSKMSLRMPLPDVMSLF